MFDNLKEWFREVMEEVTKISYRTNYGIELGYKTNESFPPEMGKEDYYNIERKYDIVDLIHNKEIIRMIPDKYIPGYYIECWENGVMTIRKSISYSELKQWVYKEIH